MTEINKLEAPKTYTRAAIDAMSHIRRGLTNIGKCILSIKLNE